MTTINQWFVVKSAIRIFPIPLKTSSVYLFTFFARDGHYITCVRNVHCCECANKNLTIFQLPTCIVDNAWLMTPYVERIGIWVEMNVVGTQSVDHFLRPWRNEHTQSIFTESRNHVERFLDTMIWKEWLINEDFSGLLTN